MELSRPGDVPKVNSGKEGANSSEARASFMMSWMQRLRGGEASSDKDDNSETKKKAKKKSKKFGKYILDKLGLKKEDKDSDRKQDDYRERSGLFTTEFTVKRSPKEENNDTGRPEIPDYDTEIDKQTTTNIEKAVEITTTSATEVVDENKLDVHRDLVADAVEHVAPTPENNIKNPDYQVLYDTDRVVDINERSLVEKPVADDSREVLAEESVANLSIEHDKMIDVDLKLKKELQDLHEQVDIIEKDADKLKKDTAKRYEQARTRADKIEQNVTTDKQEQARQEQDYRLARQPASRENYGLPNTKEIVAKPPVTERNKEATLNRTESKQRLKTDFKDRVESLKREAELKKTIESYEGIKGSKLTEREIERRHEVKDDPSSYAVPPTADSGVSSIGSILQNINTPTNSSNAADDSALASRQAEDKSSPMYKQAVWGGFWFAIVLIITVILLVLSL